MAALPTALVDLVAESPRLRTVLAFIGDDERAQLVAFVEAACTDAVRRRRAALVAMTLAGHRGGG